MSDYAVGPITSAGCVTSVMVLRTAADPSAIPAVIERDRRHMAARPGLNRKLLPVRPDPVTGHMLSGGAYLFDTLHNAQAFARWTAEEFVIDGVPFVRQPMLIERTAKVWAVIGAHDFRSVFDHQIVMRVSEWQCGANIDADRLAREWPAIAAHAQASDASSAWLLHDAAAGEMALVRAAGRVAPRSLQAADIESLSALERAPCPLARFEREGAARGDDRTSFVFSVWFPLTGAATDRAPLWPNSPPLPGP